MLKMKKQKLLISLLIVAVVAILFGNVMSDATQITTNSVTVTPSTTNATNTNAGSISINATTTNATTNNKVNTNSSSINAAVSSYNNTNTNSTVNTAKNTANTSKLPYAGNGNILGAVVLAVAFVGSALYAYKKVSDYNV